MAGMPYEILEFWNGIDPYAAGGHVSEYFTDRIGDAGLTHHLSFHPSFMPLLFFEEGEAGDRKFFLGSVKGLSAELEDAKTARGSVFLNTYLGTRSLKKLRVDCGKGTLDAYVGYHRCFHLFGGGGYRGLATDQIEVGSALREAGVWDINMESSPWPLTVERLVGVLRKYNYDIRGNSVDIHPSDPFGFVYNCTLEELDRRIEEELAKRRKPPEHPTNPRINRP